MKALEQAADHYSAALRGAMSADWLEVNPEEAPSANTYRVRVGSAEALTRDEGAELDFASVITWGGEIEILFYGDAAPKTSAGEDAHAFLQKNPPPSTIALRANVTSVEVDYDEEGGESFSRTTTVGLGLEWRERYRV